MSENKLKENLEEKVDRLIIAMEKMKIAEYVEYLHNPKRMLAVNFLAGIARGLGYAVGFTILGALLIYLLQRVVVLNLPVIGEYLTELVQLVTENMSRRP